MWRIVTKVYGLKTKCVDNCIFLHIWYFINKLSYLEICVPWPNHPPTPSTSFQLPETVKGKDYSQGILTGKYRKVKKPVSQFFYQQKEKGVRTDRYSYLVTGDGNYQLFDNLKDPYQIHSLKIEEIPSIQTKLLKKELGNWLKVSEDGWAKEHKFPDRITY